MTSSGAVGEAAYELEAGPDLVDRAHLDVDHAGVEADPAYDVVVEVGRRPRGLLGPADPDHPGLLGALDQLRHPPGQGLRAGVEGQADLEVPGQASGRGGVEVE